MADVVRRARARDPSFSDKRRLLLDRVRSGLASSWRMEFADRLEAYGRGELEIPEELRALTPYTADLETGEVSGNYAPHEIEEMRLEEPPEIVEEYIQELTARVRSWAPDVMWNRLVDEALEGDPVSCRRWLALWFRRVVELPLLTESDRVAFGRWIDEFESGNTIPFMEWREETGLCLPWVDHGEEYFRLVVQSRLGEFMQTASQSSPGPFLPQYPKYGEISARLFAFANSQGWASWRYVPPDKQLELASSLADEVRNGGLA